MDSAATAQKPKYVIEALCDFYKKDYANIHR
jgi:selenocysteine lyase/cysteine desulfurase